MKIRFHLILIAIAVFCSQSLNAAEIGSFDTSVTFSGESRNISCYVTDDYVDDTPAGLLIGLHGMLDNSFNYRNALIQQLQWNVLLPNTVMIFPDGGNDQNRDFFAPEGDELIIDTVIAWAKRNYNIDENNIILQGFSLGGRSALKYGLDHSDIFAGLILHTPAMQGPLDVKNVPGGYSLMSDYNTCGDMPISISHGTNDYGYINSVGMLADSLISHNANLLYLLIPDFPHSVPPNSINSLMFDFVSKPHDAERAVLHSLTAPAMVYKNEIKLNCRARNMSAVPASSITFQYELNGEIKTFDWAGSLTDQSYVDVELVLSDLPTGFYQCKMFMTMINGEPTAENVVFNSVNCEFLVLNESLPIPFHEKFNNPNEMNNNWSIKESGNYLSWMYDDISGYGNPGSMAMLNLNPILTFANWGLIESLLTNRFDFSTAETPAVSFDVAFNYTIYGPPYYTENMIFTDTLEVLMTNDNWETSVSIFKKWGEDLATYETPYFNVVDMNQFFLSPLENQWKTIKIDLSEHETSDRTMFRFDYISGSGGVIYLDNFKAYDTNAVSVRDITQTEFSVYPNPASANQYIVAQFDTDTAGDISIRLFDISGQKAADLYSGTCAQGANSFAMKVPNLSSGVYIMETRIGNSMISGKLIIK